MTTTRGRPVADLGGRIRSFDDRVDRAFEHLRGRPVADVTAKVVSGLGDHGLVWALSTAWIARRPGGRRSRALRSLAAAGVGSAAVNAGVKAVVGRSRPERSDLQLRGDPVPLREPVTSSFPSGHTLAAFCAATVLAEPGRPVAGAARFGFAASVGTSRIHVRAHHASDVVGGVVIGVGLGLVTRAVLRRW